MATKKKFYMFLQDYEDAFNTMSDESLGKMFRRMMNFHLHGEDPGITGDSAFAWSVLKDHLVRMNDYGEKQGNKNKDRDPPVPPESPPNPLPNPNPNPNPNPIKSKGTIQRKRFKIPKIEELREYSFSIGYSGFDPQSFSDHYESNGWMVGKNKMKSWTAAVRNWRKRDIAQGPLRKEQQPSKTIGRCIKCKAEGLIRNNLCERCEKEKSVVTY